MRKVSYIQTVGRSSFNYWILLSLNTSLKISSNLFLSNSHYDIWHIIHSIRNYLSSRNHILNLLTLITNKLLFLSVLVLSRTRRSYWYLRVHYLLLGIYLLLLILHLYSWVIINRISHHLLIKWIICLLWKTWLHNHLYWILWHWWLWFCLLMRLLLILVHFFFYERL